MEKKDGWQNISVCKCEHIRFVGMFFIFSIFLCLKFFIIRCIFSLQMHILGHDKD